MNEFCNKVKILLGQNDFEKVLNTLDTPLQYFSLF